MPPLRGLLFHDNLYALIYIRLPLLIRRRVLYPVVIEAAPPIIPGLDLSWNEVPFHAFLAGIPTVAFRLGLYGLLDDWQSDERCQPGLGDRC
ncbi:hypothetical protein [Streptomyces sp. NPDC005407]|uniref:hypothetical protein n=1 Tax=Streptomyces sp. NPDC005407 TaxID=3155340 RepID=UPI0033B50193